MASAACPGSLGSNSKAVLDPRVAKCLSIQFKVMFNLAPLNQLTSGIDKSCSSTLSQGAIQSKFSRAMVSQKSCGVLEASLQA